MAWKVLFFQTVRGDYPVQDFMMKQNKPTYAKLIGAIERTILEATLDTCKGNENCV